MGRDRQGDSALVLESIHRLEPGQEVATIFFIVNNVHVSPRLGLGLHCFLFIAQ